MNEGDIKVAEDPVADRLDELGTLGAFWLKHREYGRTPIYIRAALIGAAQEVSALASAKPVAPEGVPFDFCPVDIEVLMRCYYSPEPYPRVASETVERALQRLKEAGLIDRISLKATGRGARHVGRLCTLRVVP